MRPYTPLVAMLTALFLAPAAHGSFHLMQIEQAMGGACGDLLRGRDPGGLEPRG